MGNNRLGATMAKVAEAMIARRRDGETALELLDAAADAADIRGMDLDFDDQDRPDEPLGLLMFEAFAPNGIEDAARYAALGESIDDDEFEQGSAELAEAQARWNDLHRAVYDAFTKRYDLH